VTVGPHPDEAFRRSGVKFTPPKENKPEKWPADWTAHPERLSDTQRSYFKKIGLFASVIAESQLDDLIAFGRAWKPDLIIHDGTQFAGPVAASALGVPNARYLLGYPGQLRVDTCYGPEPVPEYVELFKKFGAEQRIEPTAWIDPCPPSVQYAQADNVLPMRYVPYNGPGVIPDWLREPPSRPRVCVSWGHTTAEWEGKSVRDLVQEAINAVDGLDVELVLALSPTLRDLLGELPKGTRTVVRLPIHTLLPTCAAVVHHCGPGTAMTAAASGVPQLMITNHPHNGAIAARIAATGAGRHVLADDVTGVAHIRDEVATLLEKPSYREDAGRLAQEIAAAPSPLDVVARLERLV
jgi:hypothetical protein